MLRFAVQLWALLSMMMGAIPTPTFGFVRTTTNAPCCASSTKLGANKVLEAIACVDWEGSCRFADAELRQGPLELQGGIRFDLEESSVKLQSFVVFPNGKSRELELSGKHQNDPIVRLDSTNGPISMDIAPVGSDTLLINEVEKSSGRIMLTSSLSLVWDTNNKMVEQLIMVSHEVSKSEEFVATSIVGHQIWRFHRKV